MHNKEMEQINEFMLSVGFELKCREDESHYIYNKTVEGIKFVYLLVAPHSGTKNRFMLRADALELHDRWANCDFQRFYRDIEDFKHNWGKYLIFDENDGMCK